jgi:beta-lactamase class A
VTAAELVTGLSHDAAGQRVAAVAGRAAASGGHVGLLARHLESGEELAWNPGEVIGTASAVKVAIYAEVIRQRRLGRFDLDDAVVTREADLVGGSGVLSVMRSGLRCTVADLCTLMIVVSDNTATNMLIDMLGGTGAVNEGLDALGYHGIRLNHKIGHAPPPLVVASPRPSRRARSRSATPPRRSSAVCSRTCTPGWSSTQPHRPR